MQRGSEAARQQGRQRYSFLLYIMIGLFIFRRDFRVKDNIALSHAMRECDVVYPIFIFTPEQVIDNEYKSTNAIKFMLMSLRLLAKKINITFFHGKNDAVMSAILKSGNPKIDSVYFNRDCTPYAVRRDANIEKLCAENNVNCKIYNDYYLLPYNSVTKKNNDVYFKFTPFYNAAIKYIMKHPIDTRGTTFSVKKARKMPQTHQSMLRDDFFNDFDMEVGNMDLTALSPYIKFGMVSIRAAYAKASEEGRRNILWREFYAHMLYRHPHLMAGSERTWVNNKFHISMWKTGNTGVPVVDANMRKLNATGHIDNRGRLVVGFFLVKSLEVDWRIGEMYFAQTLIDYDPCINNFNWQWIANYRYTMSPWRQSRQHYRDGAFIKKWVPELASVEVRDIHNWNKKWNARRSTYPKPIVL
jgi:deoxyribodipyrimidine photo-lyase